MNSHLMWCANYESSFCGTCTWVVLESFLEAILRHKVCGEVEF